MAIGDVIARLSVNLDLNTASFEKNAKTAGRTTKQTGDRMEELGFKVGRAAKAFVGIGVAIAGSAIVGQVNQMAREFAKTGKEIERAAQLSNAGVEEFQRAAFAAQSVGIQSEKLADIYKDMNDRVGEFVQTGGGEMKDFFEKIAPKVGVTAEAFRKLSGPEALQLYYTSLEKAGLNQQEMTFYMESLADEASGMIPLLRNGGTEIKRLGDQAAVLNKQDIEGLKRMDQAFGRLDNSVQNVGVAFVRAGLVDKLTVLIDKMAALTTKVAGLYTELDRLAKTPLGRVLDKLGAVASYANPVNLSMRAIEIGLNANGARPAPRAAAPAPAGRTSPPAGGYIRKPVSAPWGNTTSASPYLTGSGMGGRIGMGQLAALAYLPSPQVLQAIAVQAERASNAFFALVNSQILFQQTHREIIPQSERIQNAAGNIMSTMRNRVVKITEDMSESFEVSADRIIGSLDRIGSAFSRGGGFLDKLSAILGFGLTLGSVGAFGSKVATNIKSSNVRVPGFASGTNFAPGGISLVGERGPELVDLPRGSRVTPNHKIGGSTVIINANDAVLASTVKQWVAQGMQMAANEGSTGAQVALAVKSSRRYP